MSAMAAIYVDVISPLGPRLRLHPAVLQSPQVQAKVRATLLAGIRAGRTGTRSAADVCD